MHTTSCLQATRSERTFEMCDIFLRYMVSAKSGMQYAKRSHIDLILIHDVFHRYLVQDMAVHAKGQPQSVFATVQPAAARPKYLLAIFRELATGKCMAPPDMPLPVLDTSRRHLVTATAPGVGGSGGSTGPSAQRP
eukprot:TRINITY_DN1867_c0_g1_i2.p1 TRINITY_DN1867_c0_g1~~TRINITY_DN1867_c0_g1_i2.p1  ORF type:complete len:136 (-),score=15.42 TRINITY_DN1867_c0_g1_i2:674-1081(-)